MANRLLLSQKIRQDFTRAKTIGEDYTKERLKERIAKERLLRLPLLKNALEISLI
jgi:hypothetical protein